MCVYIYIYFPPIVFKILHGFNHHNYLFLQILNMYYTVLFCIYLGPKESDTTDQVSHRRHHVAVNSVV